MSGYLLTNCCREHRYPVIPPMFASAERGAWYDPRFITGGLYIDSAGTIPVTTTGQSVGFFADSSGNGNHLTQATLTKQPTFQIDSSGFYYLQFSGAQCLVSAATSSLALRTLSMMGVCAFKYDGAGVGQQLFARAIAGSENGRYGDGRAASGVLNTLYQTGGTTYLPGAADTSTAARVATSVIDRTAGSVDQRVNRSSTGTSAFTPDTATDFNTNRRFVLGAFPDATDTSELNYLTGRFYGMVIRIAAIDTTMRDDAEKYMGRRLGIEL